jgi:uncharacterized membrane protein YcaP (DUF421 family)
MNDFFYTLFGEGKDLTSLQMGFRAFIMFFITLAMIRISGMRSFGQKSAFDAIIVILLGAILSRAVAGASGFIPTVVAGLVLSMTHRLLALATIYNEKLGKMVKGEKTILYFNGELQTKNLIYCCLSLKDIMEEVRLQLNDIDMKNVKEIYMERSGRLSIIKKDEP